MSTQESWAKLGETLRATKNANNKAIQNKEAKKIANTLTIWPGNAKGKNKGSRNLRKTRKTRNRKTRKAHKGRNRKQRL
jgi:hypothetical protein